MPKRGDALKRPDFRQSYIDDNSGLRVIFRNREFSGAYPPDKILPLLVRGEAAASDAKASAPDVKTSASINPLIITATDAELYGLRHEDPTGEMEKIVKAKNLETMTMSRFMARNKTKKPIRIKLLPSSWESTPKEVAAGHPYALWKNPKNKIQVYLWRLAELSLALGEKNKKDKNIYWHKWHLERGLASCTFWWASARDFKPVFGPYAWSPDDIERGLEDMIRSVRSFSDFKTKKKKLEAEAYYLKIKKMIWEEHWKKHWKKQYE